MNRNKFLGPDFTHEYETLELLTVVCNIFFINPNT